MTMIATSLLDQLSAIVGAENCSNANAQLDLHSRDAGFHHPQKADVVVWPTTAEQVAAVLRLANEALIPVTPWGVGTSLEGNPIPTRGGILLSLAKMDAIVEVHADDFQVTVQPGIPHKDLNAKLSKYGLFFP